MAVRLLVTTVQAHAVDTAWLVNIRQQLFHHIQGTDWLAFSLGIAVQT